MGWLARYMRFWSQKLDALEALLNCARAARKQPAPGPKKDV